MTKASNTLAFIMEPLEGNDVPTSTSFTFMLAGAARGCRILHVRPDAVELVGDDVMLRATEVEVFDSNNHFRVVDLVSIKAIDCAAVFIRTDPPFDEHYLTVCWILSFAEAKGARIINSPKGLRDANEHLYGLFFPELCPATVVSSSSETIRSFVDAQGGEAIAKPIDGHAGFGVVQLRLNDSNCNAIIDMLTCMGKQPTMVQEIVSGEDKRLLLVDGELRGAVMRIPKDGEHRSNIQTGGRAVVVEITDADRHIAATMSSRFRSDGLFFVGLDVMGDKLIEVNVTSPALARTLLDLGGPDIAAEVIDRVLEREVRSVVR